MCIRDRIAANPTPEAAQAEMVWVEIPVWRLKNGQKTAGTDKVLSLIHILFMVLVDNGVNIGVKRQQLMDCLVDYVENSPHFYKNVDKAAEGERADRKNRIVPAAGPGLRDLGRRGLKAVEETAASNETGPKEEKLSLIHISFFHGLYELTPVFIGTRDGV